MIDLRPDFLDTLKRLLAEIVPDCEVRIFGSRYQWTATDASDLDLALIGPGKLHWKTLTRLKAALEESSLPYRVDVLDWRAISPEFQQVIEQGYEVIQKPGLAMSSKEWNTYHLGELAEKITKGTTPTTIGYSFVESGINFIKAESVLADGSIDSSKFAFIDAETHTKLKRSQIEENDILFSMAGMVLGKTAIVRKELVPANTNQALAIIRLRKDLAMPQFVSYFMRQRHFFNYVNQSTGQSAQPNINLEEIGNLEITLPPIPIQERIAAILSALDEKIELNRQTNATLEAIAQAIFKEWFVDFNFPGATGKMAESALGLLPRGWQVGTVTDVLKLSNETITPGTTPDVEFFHFSIPAFDSGRVSMIESGALILSNKFKVRNNSILISKLNPRIPRVWAVREVDEKRSICSTEFQVLLPMKPFFYAFAVNLFSQQSVIETMKSRASGTSGSHQRIKPQDILDIEIVLPDDEILRLYENVVGNYYQHIVNGLEESASLSQIRDVLLPKLMNGIIPVGANDYSPLQTTQQPPPQPVPRRQPTPQPSKVSGR